MYPVFNSSRKVLMAAMTIVALLLGSISAFAQGSIKGKVVDANGEPIIGAGVVVVGTTNGAVTDLDGNFELNVKAGAELEVSCVGYATKKASAANGMVVALEEDTTFLDDAIVIGYGTVKVKDLTGSVTSVGAKDLEIPVSNVAEALQGKMAGVVVTMGSQNPGASPSIRVRGTKSISSSNDPLVLVDGFPGSLANVPADQIKSINVLKDAAATAIYGSRGASGVILVTTKSATEGTTSVSYNGYVQVKDSSSEVYDVMNTTDYLKFTLGYARDYNNTNYLNMLSYFGMKDTDGNGTVNNYSKYASTPIHNWQNDLLKTGITHSHNITISTGTKKSRNQLSLNYMYDDGTVIDSWYQRLNASYKSSNSITDKLDLDLNISYFNSKSQNKGSEVSAYQYRAVEPLGDGTNYAGFGNGSSYVDSIYNPIELIYASQPHNMGHHFQAITSLNYRPIEGLVLRTELGMNGSWSRSESYNTGYGTNTNSASLQRSESDTINWNTTAQYTIPFKNQNHRADIMVGNEMRMTDGSSMYYYAYEFPTNFDRARTFAFMNQYLDDSTFSTSYSTPGRSVSFFTRANYTLMDKYLFTVTVRADGSANFAPNNRWGIFPAGAFAWRVSDEPWMASTKDWLSNLKFRLSYGITGSDSIGANQWRETWSLGGNSVTTISSQRSGTENDYIQAYAPGSQMMNSDLRWEETITRNVGLDFGFLNERISGSIEGYWMTTDGLLMSTPVNSASGYTTQYQNLGTISNKGVEFQIDGDIVRNNDFTLKAGLVFQYNRNSVDYIAPSVTSTNYASWGSSEHRPTQEYYIAEGSPMGMIKAYAYDGWYTTDDFNYDAATGVYTLKDGIPDWGQDSYWTSFSLPKGQSAFPGALKLKDLDEDGVITDQDTYNFGSMVAPASGSFNLSGKWKNVDFSANFNFVLGGHIMNYQSLMNSYGSKDNRFGANRLSFVSGAYSPYRWTSNGELEFVSDPDELDKMNANATMWTPSSMDGMLVDKYLEDASYLRLKTLSIGYTLPQTFVKKVGLKNVRAYLTATNLLTITGYTGLNPEVSTSSSTTPGVDSGSYPLAKTYTFGLNISL